VWGSIVERGGQFYAQVRIGGKRTMRLLRLEDGRAAVTRAEDAEPAIERLRAQLGAAEDIAGGRSVGLGAWLDEEYADVLASRLVPHAAEQAEAYLVRFWAWATSRLGDGARMDQVTRGDAEAFIADFLGGRVPATPANRAAKARYKASYARRIVNTLRRAWSDAEARGMVRTNVWSRMRLPRVEETVVPWVAPEDLARLLRAAPPRWRPVLELLAGTGLRISEASALRWSDVDLERGILHVRAGKTRGSRRSVPVGGALLEDLRRRGRRVRGDTVVQPGSAQAAIDGLRRACHRADLPRLTLHQLRHVYASHLVVAGTPPTVVAALLGHVDGGVLVLRLYGRWYPADAQARAVERLVSFRATAGTPRASPGTARRSSAPAARAAGGTPRAARSPR